MALLNENKKFIFFHLFKCAGNSIRDILINNNVGSVEYGEGHSIPRDIECLLSQQNGGYDDYFKFTIIRNTYDWILSTYYHILVWPTHSHHDIVKNLSLRQFIIYYVEVMMNNEGIEIGKNKCVTPLEFISNIDGDIIVDCVARFENIDYDIKTVFQRIGIECNKLPSINVNPKKTMDYRKYYDKESKDLVEKYFAKDLEYFKYKF